MYDVTIGPRETTLTRDGKLRFEANAGVVVRRYQAEVSLLSFTVKGERSFRVTTAEFDSGELRLQIDGKAAEEITIHGGTASFDVQAGEHVIKLRSTAPLRSLS